MTCNDDLNYVSVELRSHINPSSEIDNFALGKKIKITLPYNTTLEDFIHKIFRHNTQDIGMIALNGRLVQGNHSLLEGDIIDIFSRITGG